MIKVLLFLFKYKILKDPTNLSYHTKEFFTLPKPNQRKVLDKYFDKLDPTFSIAAYFDTKESRIYQDNQELTFFHCYYFDKKIIKHNLININLIDKFKLTAEKKEYLINYCLELIQLEKHNLTAEDLVSYPDKIPETLSQNISFMTYLVKENCYNIKYLTYNPSCANQQRELIKLAINMANQQEFHEQSFLKNDQTLPKILETNIDFLLYLIQNNLTNIKYLTDQLLQSQTITTKQQITQTIIKTLKNTDQDLDLIQNNQALSSYLNQNEEFINHILTNNPQNVKYVDWHNLSSPTQTTIINNLTNILKEKNLHLDILKYPFRDLFYQNYQFMSYLIEQDPRWIAITKVTNKEETEKLVNQYFKQISLINYHFKLEDFLEDREYLNSYLIENKKMFSYFFKNKVPIVKYINFFNLHHAKNVVENLLKELETKDYEFHNEDYLINDKYPVILSNSYRFMRYVIDKNFNHLAYIDTSMIDQKELKRIINYAFRMVYYIRGDDKRLNFDLDGYFKNSSIIKNDYFQECLKSL